MCVLYAPSVTALSPAIALSNCAAGLIMPLSAYPPSTPSVATEKAIAFMPWTTRFDCRQMPFMPLRMLRWNLPKRVVMRATGAENLSMALKTASIAKRVVDIATPSSSGYFAEVTPKSAVEETNLFERQRPWIGQAWVLACTCNSISVYTVTILCLPRVKYSSTP